MFLELRIQLVAELGNVPERKISDMLVRKYRDIKKLPLIIHLSYFFLIYLIIIISPGYQAGVRSWCFLLSFASQRTQR
jgi:hypothetical protein